MENTDRRVFETAFELWSSRSNQMLTRQRLKRYTYGDQWGDIVRDEKGVYMPEHVVLDRTGKRSITNNLIRRLVKTIIGRYRDMAAKNSWYDTDEQSMDALCELDELDSRLLEEFLISGMAIQRVSDDDPLAPVFPHVVNVNPAQFFCNDFRDPRGTDIEMVGMLHDMSPAELHLRFGKASDDAAHELERIIASADCTSIPTHGSATAFFSAPAGRIRIVEVWSRQFDNVGCVSWWVRWFMPSGKLIDMYKSPWRHESHPFVLKFYPLTDGEIHSFVEDVVDQQRYINRLIVLMDQIMATSAKGVLLFPVGQKMPQYTWDDITRRWATPDGVLPITGNGELPQQISHSGGDANAYRLLEMELRLFDRTSGVGSALLGGTGMNEGSSGIQHYQAQVESATIALADIFNTFRSLIKHRDVKLRNL